MSGNRSRRAGIAVLALVALGASACSIPAQSDDHAIAAQNPLSVLNSTPPGTATPGNSPTTPVLVYFVFNGRLLAVPRAVPRAAPGKGALNSALNLLFTGPSGADRRNGLTSYFHPLDHVQPIVTNLSTSGLATIELDESFTLLSGTALADALGQIVYTVTGVAGTTVTGVEFTLDNGAPFAGYSPAGTILTGPLTRKDYALIAPQL
jgi:spore germination protein GerM